MVVWLARLAIWMFWRMKTPEFSMGLGVLVKKKFSCHPWIAQNPKARHLLELCVILVLGFSPKAPRLEAHQRRPKFS